MINDELKHELAERFIEHAEFLNRALHSGALEDWRRMDMTIPQIKTLILLQNMNRMRMGGIANYLGSTLSATTSIVDRLVEKGFVDRVSDPNDRRVVVCELTDSGREVIDQFWYVGLVRVEPVIQRLNVDQLESVVCSLELLRRTLEDHYRSCESAKHT